ncbi:hypothetical protein SLEP1_g26915 [Rubroshorea leprosula]|uniref:Uncharacterized protein n=1 Tax=Rubroshorea leprosula TaxID=152421 RepID=A0AAV5JV28_9ROSI|nr:hypothetical protein SLEP1_g26915 [Rubroshorea leprosula]
MLQSWSLDLWDEDWDRRVLNLRFLDDTTLLKEDVVIEPQWWLAICEGWWMIAMALW